MLGLRAKRARKRKIYAEVRAAKTREFEALKHVGELIWIRLSVTESVSFNHLKINANVLTLQKHACKSVNGL